MHKNTYCQSHEVATRKIILSTHSSCMVLSVLRAAIIHNSSGILASPAEPTDSSVSQFANFFNSNDICTRPRTSTSLIWVAASQGASTIDEFENWLLSSPNQWSQPKTAQHNTRRDRLCCSATDTCLVTKLRHRMPAGGEYFPCGAKNTANRIGQSGALQCTRKQYLKQ